MSGIGIKRAAVIATTISSFIGGGLALAPSANATTQTLEVRALNLAIKHKGDKYQYGATGPHRFDCSGLTQYVYKHVTNGKKLARTAADQYRNSKHIKWANRKIGDLVFFHSGNSSSSIYHVGIYAGNGYIWHAPHTGAVVRKEKIWTSKFWLGRY